MKETRPAAAVGLAAALGVGVVDADTAAAEETGAEVGLAGTELAGAEPTAADVAGAELAGTGLAVTEGEPAGLLDEQPAIASAATRAQNTVVVMKGRFVRAADNTVSLL